MVITITQEIVEQAAKEIDAQCITNLNKCCPIHIALRPHLLEGPFEVHPKVINYYHAERNKNLVIPLSDKAMNFVANFDFALTSGLVLSLEKVLPVEFEVFA